VASKPPQQPQLSTKQKAVVGGAAGVVAIGGILAGIYSDEGGYVNNRNDPGGATRFGVTEVVARKTGYRGDMRDFPMHCSTTTGSATCADQIYIRDYIERPGFMPMAPIEPAVADELVNTTVNMGASRPSRWFQMSLNLNGEHVAVDGKVGPGTIAAYRDVQGRYGKVAACVVTLNQLDAFQKREYDRLVAANPNLRIFYRGWITHRIGNVDRRACGHGWQ
jgi:lysozyme family protein